MKIKNISESTIIFMDFINGEDLTLQPNQESIELIPNKDILRRALNKIPKVEVLVSNSEEVQAISELDARASELIKYIRE